jgi:hypothetical protein
VSIDALIARDNLRPPDYVMIDVEGGEFGVLKGMARTIAAHRPTIACEIHWTTGELVRKQIHDLFGPDLYRVTLLDGGALPEDVAYYHILMVPSGSSSNGNA